MPPPATSDYAYAGPFDRAAFQREFAAAFGRSGRYNAAALPDLLLLLGMIERDPAVNDLRHAAYMMATVMWETTSPTTVSRAAVDKKGRPLLDKNKRPIIVKQRRWLMTMAPVSEVGAGKGRRYHEPVKVKQLDDGRVRITEQDGDQFVVASDGQATPLTKKAVMGTKDGGAAVKAYDDDDGVEQAYFGRGYVQLTWWSNYASAGVAIGRGLDLLLDPERVKQPEVAYALMSHGMRTGKGFANNHKLSDYFSGSVSHYQGARRMVNGTDHAADIAAIAIQFESVLRKSRIVPATVTGPAVPAPAPAWAVPLP